MPRVRNFSHLVKVGPMATRREPVALRDQLVETIHRIDAAQPLMVRSALFARVSNHEATYAAILRDARLRRVPQDEEEMTCCFNPKPFQALNPRAPTGHLSHADMHLRRGRRRQPFCGAARAGRT